MNKSFNTGDFVYFISESSINNIRIPQYTVGIIEKIDENKLLVETTIIDSPFWVENTHVVIFDPDKTGDSFNFKICNVCCRRLPIDEFQKNQNGKGNRTVRRPSCNDCRSTIDGKNIPLAKKREWEKTKPNRIIWKCPICGKKTIPGITSKVVLDHNHHTGEPRGWICDSCNTGLGRFQDSEELLETAINYVITNSEK